MINISDYSVGDKVLVQGDTDVDDGLYEIIDLDEDDEHLPVMIENRVWVYAQDLYPESALRMMKDPLFSLEEITGDRFNGL